MNFKNISVFLVITLTIFALPVQGQSHNNGVDPSNFPGLPPAKKDDLLCLCITTFLLEKGEVFYFKIDNNYHKVNLAGEGLSLPFPVRGSTIFTLYKKAPAGNADAPPYVPVIKQPLEGSGEKFFIVLSRKDGKSPLKAKALNISKNQLPADHIHLFNESPVAIGLQVNTTQTVVTPSNQYQYAFVNPSRKTYTSAKIIMRYKGEKKIMASKRLRLVPNRRIILICFLSRSRANLGATPLRMITYQDKP